MPCHQAKLQKIHTSRRNVLMLYAALITYDHDEVVVYRYLCNQCLSPQTL